MLLKETQDVMTMLKTKCSSPWEVLRWRRRLLRWAHTRHTRSLRHTRSSAPETRPMTMFADVQLNSLTI